MATVRGKLGRRSGRHVYFNFEAPSQVRREIVWSARILPTTFTMCFVIPTAPRETKCVDLMSMHAPINFATIVLTPMVKLRVVVLECWTCVTVFTNKVATVRVVGARTIRDAVHTVAAVDSPANNKEGMCRRQVGAGKEDKGKVGHDHHCNLMLVMF